jgi:hypothetical protein
MIYEIGEQEPHFVLATNTPLFESPSDSNPAVARNGGRLFPALTTPLGPDLLCGIPLNDRGNPRCRPALALTRPCAEVGAPIDFPIPRNSRTHPLPGESSAVVPPKGLGRPEYEPLMRKPRAGHDVTRQPDRNPPGNTLPPSSSKSVRKCIRSDGLTDDGGDLRARGVAQLQQDTESGSPRTYPKRTVLAKPNRAHQFAERRTHIGMHDALTERARNSQSPRKPKCEG